MRWRWWIRRACSFKSRNSQRTGKETIKISEAKNNYSVIKKQFTKQKATFINNTVTGIENKSLPGLSRVEGSSLVGGGIKLPSSKHEVASGLVVGSLGRVEAGIIVMEGGEEESNKELSSIWGLILLRGGKAGFGDRGGASSTYKKYYQTDFKIG